mmetsp:Transcript_47268/g.141093  ORF Transcript_47268/g.141093 Transcript_47268/m.141093 type:complete len:250 (-) Transcript_47268:12-761(-)
MPLAPRWPATEEAEVSGGSSSDSATSASVIVIRGARPTGARPTPAKPRSGGASFLGPPPAKPLREAMRVITFLSASDSPRAPCASARPRRMSRSRPRSAPGMRSWMARARSSASFWSAEAPFSWCRSAKWHRALTASAPSGSRSVASTSRTSTAMPSPSLSSSEISLVISSNRLRVEPASVLAFSGLASAPPTASMERLPFASSARMASSSLVSSATLLGITSRCCSTMRRYLASQGWSQTLSPVSKLK